MGVSWRMGNYSDLVFNRIVYSLLLVYMYMYHMRISQLYNSMQDQLIIDRD